MKYLYFIVCFCSLPICHAYAQWEHHLDERKFQLRVKQIDEFMVRFNGTDENKPQIAPSGKERTRCLRNLFNVDAFRDEGTGDLNVTGKDFISRVLADSIQLHFEDSTWQAEVLCDVLLQDVPCRMTFVLQPERIRQYEYKWVIKDVQGTLFERLAQHSDTLAILSPVEHETGFIGLIELPQTNARHFTDFYPAGYLPDRLSALNAWVHCGLLKIVQPQEVVYVFRNVPGYEFRVERFEKRGSYNTGWLISSLQPVQTKKTK